MNGLEIRQSVNLTVSSASAYGSSFNGTVELTFSNDQDVKVEIKMGSSLAEKLIASIREAVKNTKPKRKR
jgi:ABC-type molybdate transport system substrate-binding protein